MEEEDISDDPSSCLLHLGGDELLVAASSSSSTASTTHSVLPRSLGAFDLTLIGIGASIGSGIFVLSGVALEEAGPGVVVSFMVAAAVCVLSALCYAELSTRYPSSGGAYLFTRSIWTHSASQRHPSPPFSIASQW